MRNGFLCPQRNLSAKENFLLRFKQQNNFNNLNNKNEYYYEKK